MHISQLVLRHLSTLLWRLLNAVVSVLQLVVWELNGTAARKRRIAASLGQSGDCGQPGKADDGDDHWMTVPTAQVLRVVARFKLDSFLAPANLHDFIALHEGFETPEYLLRDYVTVYCVNEREALFVETRPGLDVWRAGVSPFLMAAQFEHAVRIHRLPIAAFHRLADRLGDPKGRLIFLTNTARCGSTMLTQMFETTGRVVAISEPYSLNVLTVSVQKGRTEEIDRRIVSTVRVLCKQTSINEIAHVLKLTAPTLYGLGVIDSLFPNATKLFMYRDSLKVAQSLYRLSEALASLKTAFTFGKGSKRRLGYCSEAMGFPKEYATDVKHDLSIGAFLWTLSMKKYVEFRESGMDVVAIRYEDVASDPEKSMRRILSHCRLPEELAVAATAAMTLDSQRSTPFANHILNQHRVLEYSGEAKAECDRVMAELGAPCRLGEKYVAPGTITSGNAAVDWNDTKWI
jgi:hypothetical protein